MNGTSLFGYYFSMGSVVPFIITYNTFLIRLFINISVNMIIPVWNVFEGACRRHHVIKGDLGKYMDSE